MRIHALSMTTAATALVAATLLTGGAALADNNCPPPDTTGASSGGTAGAGTNGSKGGSAGTGGVAGTADPNTSSGANGGTNGATNANGAAGTNGAADNAANANGGSTGGGGTADTNGTAGADTNGSASGGAAATPDQVAQQYGSASGPATLLIDCGDQAKVQPQQYTLACADGTNYLTDLRWTYWSRNSARATGLQYANDCTPDCAHGTFHAYSAIVTVNQRKRLPGYHGVSYFSHMRLDYGTPRPGDLDHQDYTLTP